ncbi:MAG: hypothetical protein NTZ13_04305 [Candidatus Parcubacteria bacterium]|nr:hypothetical protein [Candidatus Parcubacteria bacterium]
MKETFGASFEKAVQLLSAHLPPVDDHARKPVLFHDIRVGVYLYENKYPEHIVLSGILHDAIEWFNIDESFLKKEFGDRITKLVLASTKDFKKGEKTTELISRCVQNGEEALIVKTADIIDGFKWYSSQDNKEQLLYCLKNAEAILKLKPNNFNDKIFKELEKLTSKDNS